MTDPLGPRRRRHRYSSDTARPFLKWAGGKTDLLPALRERYPASCRTYFDPFVGSGAVAFDVIHRLSPERVVLSDRNAELVEAFGVVRDRVDDVIELLRAHEAAHGREHYYAVRGALPATAVERTARLIYLNKTCFNGLYRLNRAGMFNVPIGRQPRDGRALIVDEPNLRLVAVALRGVELLAAPFHRVLGEAGPGDFVYLDPPYVPRSKTACFTDYDGQGFVDRDHEHVAWWFHTLAARGCHVVASNNDVERVRELYRGAIVHRAPVFRKIRARKDSTVEELLLVGRAGAEPARRSDAGPLFAALGEVA